MWIRVVNFLYIKMYLFSTKNEGFLRIEQYLKFFVSLGLFLSTIPIANLLCVKYFFFEKDQGEGLKMKEN